MVKQDDALRYVFPDGRTFKSPSAAGRAITGNQVNGYQFWSVVDGLKSGYASDSMGGTSVQITRPISPSGRDATPCSDPDFTDTAPTSRRHLSRTG